MVIEEWKNCGIATKFPTYRNSAHITVHSWLAGKQIDDAAEGLWRIHDTLYDLTDFIDKHPGGSFWLKETKGTDITEAFESHHMSLGPAKLLEKYEVRPASKPRLYTLTIKEDGFYKTLKNRVRERLKNIDVKKAKQTSDMIHSVLLVSIFLTAWLSMKLQSNLLLLLSAACLNWTVIVAHNYFHQKNNWRMYTFNLSMMNVNAWRVSHALSHHIYPNTYYDLELSMYEPLLCWVPNPHLKSKFARYMTWVMEPITYFTTFFFQIISRVVYSIRNTNIMYWNDLICLSLPLFLYATTGFSLGACIKQWLFIISICSYIFCIIGLNAAHHDPKIYHEGDANRDDRDWGLFQVDTIIERTEMRFNIALTLTHFGDHTLHHLFPTLDHAILPQLYPVLLDTLAEFKAELRDQSMIQHWIGQHKQLIRTTTNPNPPSSCL